jgi:hypothetical protein
MAKTARQPASEKQHVLPIAIRSGVVVEIVGLPFDLTKAEAQKVANIILAHGS